MRIFNKKGFIEGITFLCITLFGFISMLITDFSVKQFISSFILLILGITSINRSLSPKKSEEDLFLNNDERDKYITLLTAHKSLQILHYLNFSLIIIFMISYAITKIESLLITYIVLSFYFTASFFIEAALTIHYEKHR